MELRITGPQTLNGEITVSGAKNSATRVLAAAMLSDGNVTLRQFPLTLVDVRAKMKFLTRLGARFAEDADRSTLNLSVPDLSVAGIEDFNVPVRTTYLLAGGLLARGDLARVIIGLMFLALFVLLEGKPSAVIFLFFGLVLAGAQNAVVPTDFRAEDLTDSDSYAYFAFVYTPLLVFGTAMLAWLAAVTGYQGRIVTDPSKPDGTPRKLMDVSRLTQMGWSAQIGLDQGLSETYQWFLANSETFRR